jgi:hypothetical protein
VLALFGLLATASPVQAGSTTAGEPRLPDRVAMEAPGLSEGVPEPPPALRPKGPRTLPPSVKGAAIKLGKPTTRLRMVEGAEGLGPTCVPYISKLTEPNPAGNYTVRVDYLAEIVCNFYLNGYGRPYLIDRTDGASGNGGILHLADGFLFANDYYGYRFGSVVIDGRTYNGARQAEVGFDLALRTTDGTIWGACYVPLPNGQRYLSTCDGLGTNTLYVTVGSGIFDTGLPPFNPAAVIRDSSRIALLTFHVGGQSDPASTARQNIVDVANGSAARTSTFSHVGATNVNLDRNMLMAMIYMEVWDGFSFRVTALAGSRHGSANSAHYRGKALDVDRINGMPVNASNPFYTAFESACFYYGASLILGPGDPDHDTHIHCAWP